MKKVLEIKTVKEYVCPQVDVEEFSTEVLLASAIGNSSMDVEKDTIDFFN